MSTRLPLTILLLFTLSLSAASQPTLKPLRAAQVVALVAGGALPSNIVHEIVTRGVAFTPDQEYLEQLKQAGADASVFDAVNRAKVIAAGDAKSEKELLHLLSSASVLMKNKRFDEAAAQLSSALTESFAGPETGFMMARVLCQKNEWQQADAIYS